MFRTLILALSVLSPPCLKPWLLRLAGARVGRHVRVGWLAGVFGSSIDLGDFSAIRTLTLIRVDGDVRIGAYAVVSSMTLVYGAGSFYVGEQSYVGPQSLINADEDVRIGRHSAIGARAVVYTHGSFLPYTEGYWVSFGPVTIGDHVWCAAGVFIRPGVTVGDRAFVNSRSVVTNDVGEGEVVEGYPARVVTTTDRLKRAMTPERLETAAWRMIEHFGEVVVKRRWRANVDVHVRSLAFSLRRRRYLVACVGSGSPLPAPTELRGTSVIALVTASSSLQSPPPGVMVFDLRTGVTKRHRDKVFRELDTFLRRYYGVQFRYD
ncbi:MAG: acyltransferase [Armatimonadota bacterium]|nr:acyltransferase [Armatimonadota bacterium]